MTAVVVAILDRDNWDASTDIIVVADSSARRLTWVPRDLWVERLRNRVAKAFARGGGELLMATLNELGFPCEGVLCLRRGATEGALSTVTVTVPVTEPLDFWYPLHPTQPIEEGRKAIAFRPPEEVLSGERLHQWIGARKMVNRSGSDFFRLQRQQVLLRALLAGDYDFSSALRDPNLVRTAGRNPLPVLAEINSEWSMRTFDAVVDAVIDGKAVLVRKSGRWLWRIVRRLRAAVLSV